MMVLTGKKFACVKITGRANFTLSIEFQMLLNELRKNGFTFVVMDLSDCMLMDSTFLGMLTGFGLKMTQANGESGPHTVELLNPNARISELLDNLGVLHLFKVRQGNASLPDCVEQPSPQAANPNQQQLTRACLEAHETLMSLNAENAKKFKDVAQYLAEELKKQRAVA